MNTARNIQELEEQLKLKNVEHHYLLEITKGIIQNKSIDYLLSIYKFILIERIGLEKFSLFIKQNEWKYLLKYKIKGKIKNIDVERDLLRFQNITMIESSSNKGLNEFNAVIPIIHQNRAIAFLLLKSSEVKNKSDNSANVNHLTDLSFIQTLTNIIVLAIDNKKMHERMLMQERIKKELEVASEMQKLLFPTDLSSDKRLDMAVSYFARHEVGGDYYDFIPINKEEFIICIGDVSGKGIAAAMLMANFQAIIRTLVAIKKVELKTLVLELNKRVMDVAKGEKFITFFIGHYNATTRKFRYINAGHNSPILTNGKRARLLDKGTIGLGMAEEMPVIEHEELQIAPNSTLLLYTDGVVEIQNDAGEYFQTDKLIKLTHRFYPLKMEDLNSLIFSKLDEFRGEKEIIDDAAIFSCRIF